MTSPDSQEQAATELPVTQYSVSTRRAPRPQRPRAPYLTLEMTPEVIEESKERDSSHCMFATAVRNAYEKRKGIKPTHVSVDIQTIRFTDPDSGFRYTYMTPLTAQQAILRFDQGIEQEPFELQLRNGQVTLANMKKNKKPRSEENATPGRKAAATRAQAARAKATAQSEEESLVPDTPVISKRLARQREELHKAELVERGENGNVPDKIGGRVPPVTPVGRRRAFGLRAIKL